MTPRHIVTVSLVCSALLVGSCTGGATAWPLADYGPIQEVMRQGLAQMWAEGQSGAHYKNITGRYTQLGCGVFVDNREITVVQDFR